MDVGRSQLDRFFKEIVYGAYNGGATGQVAQALNVVICLRKLSGTRIRGLVGQAGTKHDCDVFEGRQLDLKRAAENNFRRANCRGIGRIRNDES